MRWGSGGCWGNGIAVCGSPVSAEHFHSHPTPPSPLPPSCQDSVPNVHCQQERRRGEGLGGERVLPLACLTVPDPLPRVTPRRTSLVALNLQSLSFEGWVRGVWEASWLLDYTSVVEVRVTLLPWA